MHAAEAVGGHALPLFVLGLLVVLSLATTTWWALQRHVAPRLTGSTTSLRMLGVCIGAGFAVIVASASLFAEIAETIHADAGIGPADQALTDALRASVPHAALLVFAAVTRLANTETLTVLCIAVAAALLMKRRRLLALGWVLAIAGNAVLNTTLKRIFARVRPVHDDGLVLADGFSFPSGHSSGSVVAYGMLAYLALRCLPARWHLPAMLSAVALAYTVGSSRMFLRVHFASDVVAGFASGTCWLIVCVASIEVTRWIRQRRTI